MKVAGIVAEYNPFHNGHAHHIERTKALGNGLEATHVVAIMSGNFVQRGEPAFLPKWERTKSALKGGVDLVVELPLPWAISSAENFAFGAVSLLESLGVVDAISFGSENGKIKELEKLAGLLISTKFSSLIKYFSSFGISYPEAQQKAIEEISSKKLAALLETPNNTLGIEYIKALNKLGSKIEPFTIQRFGPDHDSHLPVGDVSSASYIRNLIKNGRHETAFAFMPLDSRTILHEAIEKGIAPSDIILAERAVLALLRKLTLEDIKNLPGISEGLENRVYKAIRGASSWNDLTCQIKTKRYTMTRVNRVLISAFLGVTAGIKKDRPPYIKVLGMNEKGAEIISKSKKLMDEKNIQKIPIITRATQNDTLISKADKSLFDLESTSSDLYALTLPFPFPCGMEYTSGIVRV